MPMPDSDVPDVPDLSAVLAWRASRCPCGVPVEHPGVCDSCASTYDDGAFSELLRPARESVPAMLRWASMRAHELAQRCDPVAVRRVAGLRPLPTSVAIVGPAGSGKSSLAAAIMRDIHASARPTMPHAALERCRRAYWVSAGELEAQVAEDRRREERQGEIDFLRRAMRASVLALDNVEPHRDGVSSAVGRVIMSRRDRMLPTIITTWMSEDEAGRHYGGGVSRRAYEVTIQVRGRGER